MSARHDRIKEAIKLGGGNQAVSRATGIPLSTLGNYLTGGHETRVSFLERIAEVAGVNVEWLIGGRGPQMLADGWPGTTEAVGSAPEKIRPEGDETALLKRQIQLLEKQLLVLRVYLERDAQTGHHYHPHTIALNRMLDSLQPDESALALVRSHFESVAADY